MGRSAQPETGEMDVYLEGRALYGDNFNSAEIAEWYFDEKEAYANLGAKHIDSYKYGYHAWNEFHAYRYLPSGTFKHVLGFGSAYGEELLPIIPRIEQLTILEPSVAFPRSVIHGVPVAYLKPGPNGSISLPSASFDLVTCFGVLHHIPNVSYVVRELVRIMKPGGYLAMREPIISMGDWRKPRRGLTRRERGIPLRILTRIVGEAGLDIVRVSLCDFQITRHLFAPFLSEVFNSRFATWIDALLAAAFKWNLRYHARNNLQRLRPASAFLVLRRPD